MGPFAGMLRCVVLIPLLSPCLCLAEAHPVPLDEHSSCVECHADLVALEHVHPAVKLGCTSCHVVENRENVTYVALKSAGGGVCWQCHPREKLLRAHFPYASGMCMKCHVPHASANPRLLRAKVNDLCLSCHLHTRETAPSRYMPTIELTLNNTVGHPYQRHPVGGYPDPLAGGEMSCISCHLAHGGTKLHYLKMGSEIPEDALNQNTETKSMCEQCHMRLWGLDGEAAGKGKKKKVSKAATLTR
ncbi:MAG TPA: cytochrome c3 family protein [Candidatus Dormibacteraeota bacterium]|nr:cytochrome c3 family protein [Candidatus Dormibacteraeota bacterium]